MKRFIKRIFTLSVFMVVSLIILDILSMVEPTRTLIASITDTRQFITVNVGADEIKPYITQVQCKDNTTKLILGDSVCRQLFNDMQQYTNEISIVGSNAAITPTGQYILAEEYIRFHPEATDIYIFMLPDSLGETFDTIYGYQYAVMPFVETDLIGLLEEQTVKSMESVYGSLFMKPTIVRMIDLSGPNRKLYLNMIKEYSSSYKPQNTYDIADEYIGKIKDLCDERNIELHLMPCPVCESRRNMIEGLRSSFMESRMATWFPNYYEMIKYYPADQSDDGIHFNEDNKTGNILT